MNKVLEIHGEAVPYTLVWTVVNCVEADSDVIVQSGVKWDDLNHALAEKGIPLFFPASNCLLFGPDAYISMQLDPGPGATIGGMIATGCSGSMSSVSRRMYN